MTGLAAAGLLAAARIWALLRVQASWRAALGWRWEWIAAALAVMIAVLAGARGQLEAIAIMDLVELATALGLELLLGSVLGLAVALPGWALVGAAAESEHGLGLRAPAGQAGAPFGSVGALIVAASLAAGLGLGLHRPLCAGLLGSFDRFALADAAAWLPSAALGPWLVEQLAAITALALALATPVLLTRVLVELGVASLARVGFEAASSTAALVPGLRLVAALVALGAAWSTYPEAFARGL